VVVERAVQDRGGDGVSASTSGDEQAAVHA
jgi:hypothetical protein